MCKDFLACGRAGPPLAASLRKVQALLHALHRSDPVFGGAGPIVAASLLLSLLVLLPAGERRLARGPLGALFGFGTLVGFDAWLPQGVLGRDFLRFAALFLLLISIGRSGFLLLVNGVWVRRWSRPLPKILRDVIQALVYAVVGLLVLRAAGVEPGSLLTTSALLTAVIGLSLQDTLGNLFAGLAIQAQRPFEVGDWIRFDDKLDQVGRVIEINWRATTVLTFAQVEITVPNAVAAKANIHNYSRPNALVRREVRVHAPYSRSPEQVRSWLLAALQHTPYVLELPHPMVVANDFDERGVEYAVRYFIDRFDRHEMIEGEVRERIWYAIHRQGTTIPVPHRVLEMVKDGAEANGSESLEYRLRLLSRLEFLQDLPAEELRLLATRCRRLTYAREEYIVQQGDGSRQMYIIERGRVRIETRVAEQPQVVSMLEPGEFFGEMSLLTGEQRTADVVAAEETDVIVVGRETLAPIIERNSGLAERISQVLAERQRRLREVLGASLAPNPAPSPEEHEELLKRIRRFFSL